MRARMLSQVFKNRAYGDLAGVFWGNLMQGFSVGWWKNKHNTHHAVPNLHESSADAHDGERGVVRCATERWQQQWCVAAARVMQTSVIVCASRVRWCVLCCCMPAQTAAAAAAAAARKRSHRVSSSKAVHPPPPPLSPLSGAYRLNSPTRCCPVTVAAPVVSLFFFIPSFSCCRRLSSFFFVPLRRPGHGHDARVGVVAQDGGGCKGHHVLQIPHWTPGLCSPPCPPPSEIPRMPDDYFVLEGADRRGERICLCWVGGTRWRYGRGRPTEHLFRSFSWKDVCPVTKE